MKLFFLIIFISINSPIHLYDISFPDINGETINMSDFKGKRILVFSFDAFSADKTDFKYLDSLQTVFEDLQIIAVPSVDARKISRVNEARAAKRLIRSRIIMAHTSDLQKSGEKYQHPLFQWLTNKDNNGFVDNDGEPGQYFLISTEGTLYGFLQAGVQRTYIEKMLGSTFDEKNNYILNPETNKYEPKY